MAHPERHFLSGRRFFLGGAAAVVALPATAQAEISKTLVRGTMARFKVTQPPRPMPDLEFLDADNRPVRLADFTGQARLINLWATWCAPCRAEMPALDRLQAKAGGNGFEVVAVNVDTARLERRGPFLDGIGVKSLARYADPSGDAFETLRRNGKALGLPVTMLIDRVGCEIGVVAGAANWDSADALSLIDALKGG